MFYIDDISIELRSVECFYQRPITPLPRHYPNSISPKQVQPFEFDDQSWTDNDSVQRSVYTKWMSLSSLAMLSKYVSFKMISKKIKNFSMHRKAVNNFPSIEANAAEKCRAFFEPSWHLISVIFLTQLTIDCVNWAIICKYWSQKNIITVFITQLSWSIAL